MVTIKVNSVEPITKSILNLLFGRTVDIQEEKPGDLRELVYSAINDYADTLYIGIKSGPNSLQTVVIKEVLDDCCGS